MVYFSIIMVVYFSITIYNVAIENLKRLCGWLEMLRSEWNKRYGDPSAGSGTGDPIIINSAYRSWEVNKRAGGSSTSS